MKKYVLIGGLLSTAIASENPALQNKYFMDPNRVIIDGEDGLSSFYPPAEKLNDNNYHGYFRFSLAERVPPEVLVAAKKDLNYQNQKTEALQFMSWITGSLFLASPIFTKNYSGASFVRSFLPGVAFFGAASILNQISLRQFHLSSALQSAIDQQRTEADFAKWAAQSRAANLKNE